jgi:hypothetical protein
VTMHTQAARHVRAWLPAPPPPRSPSLPRGTRPRPPSLGSPPDWLKAASLAMGVLVGGCYTPAPVFILQGPPEAVEVTGAPPEARLEIPPAPPDESYLWQPGYWNWDGGEYQWQEGMWMPPRDGYVLLGASYNFFGGCWHYRAPYWCPSRMCGATGHPRPTVAWHRETGPTYRPAVPNRVVNAPPTVQGPVANAPATHQNPVANAPATVQNPVVNAPPTPTTHRPPVAMEPAAHRQTIVLRDEPEPRAAIGDDRPTAPRPPTNLRTLPDYRGSHGSRPVFGDDPDAVRRPPAGFRTDSTGAVMVDHRGSGAARTVSFGGNSGTTQVVVVGRPDRPSMRQFSSPTSITGPAVTSPVYHAFTPVSPSVYHAPAPVYRSPIYQAAPPSYHPPVHYSPPQQVYYHPSSSRSVSAPVMPSVSGGARMGGHTGGHSFGGGGGHGGGGRR